MFFCGGKSMKRLFRVLSIPASSAASKRDFYRGFNFEIITGEQAGVVLYCVGAGGCRSPKVDPCITLIYINRFVWILRYKKKTWVIGWLSLCLALHCLESSITATKCLSRVFIIFLRCCTYQNQPNHTKCLLEHAVSTLGHYTLVGVTCRKLAYCFDVIIRPVLRT